ncbi:hypothetical protein BCR37DRAFT_376125 [Protomyces lactucae-debilis]|uniref:Uncharacterized protein n=1 Tax=Protomyces lactucae-debilis TaxID=2754530 RepID=A0A1Y2FS67_PROLT|nr:uncharacterized protein BCR37DRAFT_376125 [Protomyces lactucae-debilis]ORY86852.1 hypothetical protein BCR37DRAFT_376125 [Protomyces lactucae-debilis]
MLVEQRSLQHEKIEAFKTRTDFYSTKSLIDRYSGSESPKSEATTPSKSQVQPKKATGSPPQSAQGKQGKTQQPIGIAPALATPPSLQGTVPTPPHLSGIKQTPRSSLTAAQQSTSPVEARHAVQDLRAIPAPHHWYDRILDVVIGEDESAASSRYQLEQRLLKKEEEVRRLEVEMMKMQQALQEREGNEATTRTLPEQEQGSTAREESGKAETRARRTSRRLKSKSTVQEDASDDDDED